jgi:hypothetical protein
MSARMAFRQCLRAALLLCFLASPSLAGTVTGTVTNGTTGKAASGVDVILIQLQGTMQPVARTKTDAEGHYRLDDPGLGTGPMLIRAVYRGVNYHEPATPGKTTVNIQVFEPTDKTSAFAVTAHAIILQPDGSDLVIGEEFNISNKTQPPVAYYRPGGSFLFSIPDGAQLSDASVVGTSGMPVVQQPVDKGKNERAIDYPFRPGDSGVRVSYRLPYPDNQAKIRFVSPYAAGRLAIFAPPSVQVSGGGFTAAGQEEGFSVYMRESVAADTPVAVAVSGTAPPPPQNGADADNSQNPSVNSRADSAGEAPTASVTTLPPRLDSLKWILVAGFVGIFALGAMYLWRQPQMVAAGAGGIVEARDAVVASSGAASVASQVTPSGDLDQKVRGSLDELKDVLFRLEVRREAGTISDDDYARERERVQKVLRDLVRG